MHLQEMADQARHLVNGDASKLEFCREGNFMLKISPRLEILDET